MSINVKRHGFLIIIICACVIGALFDAASAVLTSMLIVLCPSLLYWILRLLVPSFRISDEVSMYAGELKRAEKVEATITAVCMVALIVIWLIKVI